MTLGFLETSPNQEAFLPSNVDMPDSLQFRTAIAKIIKDNSDVVLDRVSKEFLDDRGLTVLPYITSNYDTGMFPLIMIEQRSIKSKWVAMPSLMRIEFSCNLHGMVWHDDPEVMDAMVSGLEGGLRDVLNRRHLRAPLTSTLEMFFDDDLPPIANVTFGGAVVQSRIVRGFEADFLAKAELGVPPIYPA